MKKLIYLLFAIFLTCTAIAQELQRPKLVVGIVVDQMRWDFLYRYYSRFDEKGGFKRLIGQGFSCENAMIPYAPTVTACGHASIYTGSVPAINGITGNYWWDNQLNRSVYCTEDAFVKTVGSSTSAGLQSPKNLLTNTICDELRLATNFRSKVVGIALKDRGSILPAGHSANAAYWYDSKTGDWITSTYYMTDLPQWVKTINAQKFVDKYYNEGWSTLYPINSYIQSSSDEKIYENRAFGADAKGFPYSLSKFAGMNYGVLPVTPFGNTYTMEMAKAAVDNEQLGADDISDFLAVSFSSTDYIGHSFGPNSVEAEDVYLRLDKELGEFLNFLDSKVGKDQYLLFLSADHGAAHVPGFATENKIPSGSVDFERMSANLNESLKSEFGKNNLVTGIFNSQLYLNLSSFGSNEKKSEIKDWVINYLIKQPGIARAIEMDGLGKSTLPVKVREMLTNGYNPQRAGNIQLILQPQWIEGFSSGGTTHGVWNPYDAHIPLLWYGWGIKQGKTNREVYMSDIAATVAGLLHIQMPNGSIGNVIGEVMK